MSEELENFYRDRRLYGADSVANIYNDPLYASMFFKDYNLNLPLNKVERNIKASMNNPARLEAYEPTLREKARGSISDVLQYLGTPRGTSDRVASGFMGNPSAETFGQQFGLLDIAPIVNIPFYFQEGLRALDRGDYFGGGIDVGFSLLEGALFAKPLKRFIKNQAKKLKGTPSTTEIVPTKEPIGALPNMLPSTKRASPNLVMTDPKVVDEFGFYSEAERQAKMMQQNKGSSAQFAGLLLNKGVKQDELDAVGLTDLFKNNANVTKKDIIDTIELNKVALIETKKTKQLDDGVDPDEYFATETFTDIRKGDEAFKSADEIKEAYETGNYSRPTIEIDALVYEAINDDPKPMKLYGTINTHTPTGYKTVMFENLDDYGQDFTDIYFTFRPDADVKDWRNSIEAENYVAEINNRIREGTLVGQDQLASAKNLTLEDLADLIQDYTAQSFDEAIVRLKSATIQDGVYDPGSVAKFEGNTQKGGTNYKEYLLRLPPKGDNKFGKIQLENPKVYDKNKDFQYRTHFDEFNPLFHIRTKDRVSNDGRKILYVEELQSDWGQRGAGRGFKLEGKKLAAAKNELKTIKEEMLDLKKGGVELNGFEQEEFYKLAFPNRPPIRIPFKEPKDFRAKHDTNPAKYYDTAGNVKEYEFDYSLSRMPEEFKTMTFGQYMNFNETMRLERAGEINFNRFTYRRDTILNPDDPLNKFFDDKDAEFLFAQLDNYARKDVNQFLKNKYNKYTKALGEVEGRVPSAPFVTDRNKWTALAIKRLIKIADEGDYDAIAFSPGEVQYDRWGKLSLLDYYNKIIPQVASKLPKSLGITTEKINIPIPMDKEIGLSMTSDGRYFVNNIGSDKPLDGKYFNTKEEADAYADMIEQRRTNQETFAINVTPKMKEKAKSGIPLFGFGGAIGVGATMSDENMGALGNVPSTQDNET